MVHSRDRHHTINVLSLARDGLDLNNNVVDRLGLVDRLLVGDTDEVSSPKETNGENDWGNDLDDQPVWPFKGACD